MATYAFLPGGRIACIHGRGPMQRLGILEPDAGGSGDPGGPLRIPGRPGPALTSFYPPHLAAGDRLACIAGSPVTASAVVLVDPTSGGSRCSGRARTSRSTPAT